MPICYLTENSPRSRSPTLSHPLEVDAATIFASTPVSSHLTAPLSLFPPSTPPALIRSLSPYGTRELPPLTDSHCALHFCLERSHGLPKIQWHIQTPPITAKCLQRHQGNGDWWNEPATIPPQQSLTIRVVLWDILVVVFPNQPTTPFVTIRDILSFVFRVGLERAREQDYAISQSNAPIVRRRQTVVDGPPADSLLFSAGGQVPLTPCSDENRDRGNGRDLGAKRVESTLPMNGWRWGGLEASPAVRDVWDLFLE